MILAESLLTTHLILIYKNILSLMPASMQGETGFANRLNLNFFSTSMKLVRRDKDEAWLSGSRLISCQKSKDGLTISWLYVNCELRV